MSGQEASASSSTPNDRKMPGRTSSLNRQLEQRRESIAHIRDIKQREEKMQNTIGKYESTIKEQECTIKMLLDELFLARREILKHKKTEEVLEQENNIIHRESNDALDSVEDLKRDLNGAEMRVDAQMKHLMERVAALEMENREHRRNNLVQMARKMETKIENVVLAATA